MGAAGAGGCSSRGFFTLGGQGGVLRPQSPGRAAEPGSGDRTELVSFEAPGEGAKGKLRVEWVTDTDGHGAVALDTSGIECSGAS